MINPEQRIDNILRRRRENLEGWLELSKCQPLDAVSIQLMESEDREHCRALNRAYELREALS